MLFKQIREPPETTQAVIRTLHENTKQEQPGDSKKLVELRQRYYVPNLSVHVQSYVSNCANCIKTKPANVGALTSPFQKIYDPSNDPEDVFEIDIVGGFS